MYTGDIVCLCVCLCVCFRPRVGLYCLPTSLCEHASISIVVCVIFLHAALPWTGQWGTLIAHIDTKQKNPTESGYRVFHTLVWLLVFVFFSQFAMVEVLVTSLLDEFYHTLMRIFKLKELLVLAVCCVAFLLGIPCVMQVEAMLSCMNFDPHTNSKQGLGHMILQCLSRWESMFSSWWTITLLLCPLCFLHSLKS